MWQKRKFQIKKENVDPNIKSSHIFKITVAIKLNFRKSK